MTTTKSETLFRQNFTSTRITRSFRVLTISRSRNKTESVLDSHDCDGYRQERKIQV